MEITFDISQVTSGLISLTDFPYPSGILRIISPVGTTVYNNTNLANPDFTAPTDVVEKQLPISNQTGLPMVGDYAIRVTTADSVFTDYTARLKEGGYSATILTNQSCTDDRTLVNYTSNIPQAAQIFSIAWSVTDPNGNITTPNTPSFFISPLIAGTYTILLTIVFAVDEVINGNDVNTKYSISSATTYRNTCGNALSLLCSKMFCCLKTAFFTYLSSPTTANFAALVAISSASVLMMMAMQCDKQTEAFEIFDQLNTKYNCNTDCGCGCSD